MSSDARAWFENGHWHGNTDSTPHTVEKGYDSYQYHSLTDLLDKLNKEYGAELFWYPLHEKTSDLRGYYYPRFNDGQCRSNQLPNENLLSRG